MFQAKPEIITCKTLIDLCDIGILSNVIKKEIIDDNKDIIAEARLSIPKIGLVIHEPVSLSDESGTITKLREIIDKPELVEITDVKTQIDKRVMRVDNILKTPMISTELKGSGSGRIKSFDPVDTLWV